MVDDQASEFRFKAGLRADLDQAGRDEFGPDFDATAPTLGTKRTIVLLVSALTLALDVALGTSIWQFLALGVLVVTSVLASATHRQHALPAEDPPGSETEPLVYESEMNVPVPDPHPVQPAHSEVLSERCAQLVQVLRISTEAVLATMQPERADLNRVITLIQDAVETLYTSFNQLRESAEEQARLVLSMVNPAADGVNTEDRTSTGSIRSCIDETDAILKQFVYIIMLVSKESMAAVEHIEDVINHMEGVDGLLVEAKKISQQTTLLSLNAKIQAQHAGKAGRTFGVIADEMKVLSIQSHEFAENIGTIVHDTKRSVQSTMHYIENVASIDMSQALASKAKVDEMLTAFSETNEKIDQSLLEVSRFADRLREGVAAAIRSLQFEDMARQILENSGKRIGDIESFQNKILLGVDSTEITTDQVLVAKRCADEFLERMDTNSCGLVNQESVSAGEVELF